MRLRKDPPKDNSRLTAQSHTHPQIRVCASQRGKLLIKAAGDSLVRELWSVVGKLAPDKGCSGATKESVNKRI